MAVIAAGLLLLARPVLAETPADAVIERWSQTWSFAADGTESYHELRYVRLNNDRAYSEFADPRFHYRAGRDKVELLTARTRRPDGTTLNVPAYSRNEVSPFDTAGWPAFADLRQLVLTMSGIEPGCVVELEYRILSPPGGNPPTAITVRLDHRYPVQQHEIVVESADGVNARVAEKIPGDANSSPSPASAKGYRRTFGPYPARVEESQSTPLLLRAPHLLISTAPAGDGWLAARLARIEKAADSGSIVADLAKKWTENCSGDDDRLRALQEKLAAQFNFVEFPTMFHPAALRPATVVLKENYGLPNEAAAALLALARAAGCKARPALLMRDALFDAKLPPEESVVGCAVLLEGTSGVAAFLPREGRVRRAKHAGCALHSLDGDKPVVAAMPAWSSVDESACRVSGDLKIDVQGKPAGKLTLRLSGLFVDADALRTGDAQKARLSRCVGEALPGLSVRDFSVRRLSDALFEAEANVGGDAPLEKRAECYELALSADDAVAAVAPLPLAHARRETPLEISGPFEAALDLSVTWPESWRVAARPREIGASDAPGVVRQTVTDLPHGLRWQRTVRCESAKIEPAVFLKLRESLNRLRAATARTLLLAPGA